MTWASEMKKFIRETCREEIRDDLKSEILEEVARAFEKAEVHSLWPRAHESIIKTLRAGAGEEKPCEKCGGCKSEPCVCEPTPEPIKVGQVYETHYTDEGLARFVEVARIVGERVHTKPLGSNKEDGYDFVDIVRSKYTRIPYRREAE